MTTTLQPETIALATCPFCGAPGYLMEIDGYRPTSAKTYRVICGDDDCNIHGLEYETEAEAVAWWNKRIVPAVAPEPLVMPQAKWTNAPAWAMWWAVDQNGQEFWFDTEPYVLGEMGWVNKGRVSIGKVVHADWRTLKQRRPAALGD